MALACEFSAVISPKITFCIWRICLSRKNSNVMPKHLWIKTRSMTGEVSILISNIDSSFETFWRDIRPFCGATDTIGGATHTSGDVSSWFQSQSEQPYLYLVEAYMSHVPWDSLLVQHLSTFWWPAWQPNQSLPYPCKRALIGLGNWDLSHHRRWHSTDWDIPGSASDLDC